MYTPGTEKNFHHWVLNECSKELETVYMVNNSLPDPGICVADSTFVESWTPIFMYCRRTSLVWAVGGDAIQDFPSELAYPLGGPDAEFKYFFLEMHYDNPEKIPSIFELFFYKTTIFKPKMCCIFKIFGINRVLNYM